MTGACGWMSIRGSAWVSDASPFSICHRKATSPWPHPTRRYQMVYNGEVYNFKDLAEDLSKKGHSFRGQFGYRDHSARLCGMGHSPPPSKKLNGMFTMAIWDRARRQLTLVRDRLGIKPLYFGWFQAVLCLPPN